MAFLVALAAKIVEWLLVMGGHALYESAVKLIEAQKQAKADRKNLEDYKEAVRQKDLKKQADAIRNIANGGK